MKSLFRSVRLGMCMGILAVFASRMRIAGGYNCAETPGQCPEAG